MSRGVVRPGHSSPEQSVPHRKQPSNNDRNNKSLEMLETKAFKPIHGAAHVDDSTVVVSNISNPKTTATSSEGYDNNINKKSREPKFFTDQDMKQRSHLSLEREQQQHHRNHKSPVRSHSDRSFDNRTKSSSPERVGRSSSNRELGKSYSSFSNKESSRGRDHKSYRELSASASSKARLAASCSDLDLYDNRSGSSPKLSRKEHQNQDDKRYRRSQERQDERKFSKEQQRQDISERKEDKYHDKKERKPKSSSNVSQSTDCLKDDHDKIRNMPRRSSSRHKSSHSSLPIVQEDEKLATVSRSKSFDKKSSFYGDDDVDGNSKKPKSLKNLSKSYHDFGYSDKKVQKSSKKAREFSASCHDLGKASKVLEKKSKKPKSSRSLTESSSSDHEGKSRKPKSSRALLETSSDDDDLDAYDEFSHDGIDDAFSTPRDSSKSRKTVKKPKSSRALLQSTGRNDSSQKELYLDDEQVRKAKSSRAVLQHTSSNDGGGDDVELVEKSKRKSSKKSRSSRELNGMIKSEIQEGTSDAEKTDDDHEGENSSKTKKKRSSSKKKKEKSQKDDNPIQDQGNDDTDKRHRRRSSSSKRRSKSEPRKKRKSKSHEEVIHNLDNSDNDHVLDSHGVLNDDQEDHDKDGKKKSKRRSRSASRGERQKTSSKRKDNSLLLQ